MVAANKISQIAVLVDMNQRAARSIPPTFTRGRGSISIKMSLHTNIYCATSREETYFDLFWFLYPIENLDKNVWVETLSEGETGECGEQRGDHFPKAETEHHHPFHNAGRGAEGGCRGAVVV